MPLSLLDRPEVRAVLFHPRRELGFRPLPPGARQVAWQVAPEVTLGGRLYPSGIEAPAILFFHGNGEIAADYDAIAPLYGRLGITLLVADYRGYGRSGGTPAAAHLLDDAVALFRGLDAFWELQGLAPARVYAMGRSLGTVAAVEVARQAAEALAGLILESGLADTFGLLARMGVRVAPADEEQDGFGNAAKLARITTPTLVIHGAADRLIPPVDGRALYHASAAHDKRFVPIPGGGHNDLLMVGHQTYFDAIQELVTGPAK
jgi:pimeloyl-ACP methyl ester carboxylesterase